MARNIEDLSREEMFELLTQLHNVVVAADLNDGFMDENDVVESALNSFEAFNIPTLFKEEDDS
jgi:hypothetical protein